MNQFRYGFDAVCVAACLVYAVNSWLVPEAVKGVFMSGYLNDVLLVPAALPLVLGLQRVLGLRSHNGPPRWTEIGAHLVVWAVIAEFVVPGTVPHATYDPLDLLAYSSGALAAGLWWNRRRLARPQLA